MNYAKYTIFFLTIYFLSRPAFVSDTVVQEYRRNIEKIEIDLEAFKNFASLRPELLSSMAEELLAADMNLASIAKRLSRYLDRGMRPYPAFKRALSAEQMSRFRQRIFTEVMREKNNFVQRITALGLKPHEQEKVIKTYAACIYALKSPENRTMLKPRIGEAVEAYKQPMHQRRSIDVRTKASKHQNARVDAFHLMVDEARLEAEQQKLDDFEKLNMAKCIAEQALRFFTPHHHPVKALGKTLSLAKNSPEQAFFQEHGVCSNFAAITYNLAQSLGLRDRVFVARRHVHVYIEMIIDGSWYHIHPFNSISGGYDFIPFTQKESANL